MQRTVVIVCWTSFTTLGPLAIGVAASGVKWLAVVLAGFWLLALLVGASVTGPPGRYMNRIYRSGGWGLSMWVLAIMIAGAAVTGVTFALVQYLHDEEIRESERAVQERAVNVLELSRARAQLDRTITELSAARKRNEEIEARRLRVRNKIIRVVGLINDALDRGDNVRHSLLSAQNSDPQFDLLFNERYAGLVEKWRGETETILDRELTPLRVGKQFGTADGVYGYGSGVYGITRVINSISSLRSIQAAVPAYVDQVTD